MVIINNLVIFNKNWQILEICKFRRDLKVIISYMNSDFLEYIKTKNILKAKQYIIDFDTKYNVFNKHEYLTTTELLDKFEYNYNDNTIRKEILKRSIDHIIEFKMSKSDYIENLGSEFSVISYNVGLYYLLIFVIFYYFSKLSSYF